MAKLTRERLDKYRELKAEKREMDRRSRTIDAELKQVEADALEVLSESGKSSLVRCGHRLTLLAGRVYVNWREEYIRAEGADAAEAIIAATEPPQRVEIDLAG